MLKLTALWLVYRQKKSRAEDNREPGAERAGIGAMNQDELKKVCQIQLEIMDEVHRICEKHNIRYYMIGGTLLGAIRHGGYIPWDLDIDIAMMRDSYERFREVCQIELDKRYCYVDLMFDPNYDRPHALVARKNTKLGLKYDHVNPRRMNKGIYMDIFPLDHAPDDVVLREKQAVMLRRIAKWKEYRLPYSYSFNPIKRYAHYAVSALLAWLPVRVINQQQQKIMKKYSEQETTHVCSMASRYAYSKQCMPREIYGEPVLLEFEGRKYYAPAKYEEYLSRIYGDYMTLPPVEKRQANFEIYTSVEFE